MRHRSMASLALLGTALFAANVFGQAIQYNGTTTTDAGVSRTSPVPVSPSTPLPTANFDASGVGFVVVANPADALTNNGSNALRAQSLNMVFNNTTWDRQRGVSANFNFAPTGVEAVGLLAQCDAAANTAVTEDNFGNTKVNCVNHALVTQNYSEFNNWTSAAGPNGIVNTTTAVTIKAAAGAGVKNVVNSCQIATDALSAVTELAIRDGAAGTVIWRGKLQTAALPVTNIIFQSPLIGTANTLMEVVTLTAVTGGVYVNCQGNTTT
ncbi:MAG TPA: hypothetical protein VEU95_14575 [Micropepsaceae bacterium]|nr:hypothetical protein [Micropepsaceae bacterium]